jgi:putative addiction module killer protein
MPVNGEKSFEIRVFYLIFSLTKPAGRRFPLDNMGTIVHTCIMKRIRRSSVFIKWLKKLKDRIAKALIVARVSRLKEGNPGDSGPVGEGLSEMRIHYGPGYRVYFKDTGKEIIILLCGGDKSTQQADIIRAKKIARLYEEE